MKTSSHFPSFGLLAAASLAFCFQAPLCAEEKPAVQAKWKQLTVEDTEQLNKATAASSEAENLYRKGKYAEAENQWQAALTIGQRVLGPEHPDTLTSRNNLAVALQAQGKNAEAEQEHRAVLAIRERVLGAEHPDVSNSCYNLALCLEEQKKLPEALAFMQWAETGRAKMLGSAHPYFKRAKAARERIEAAVRKAKGKQFTAEDNEQLNKALAATSEGENLFAKRKYVEAENQMRTALAIHERVLGAEHPDTLMSRTYVAYALRDQGKHAEAEKEHRAVLAIRERVLGAEHPDVFLSCSNLAHCLEAQKKLPEALAFMQRAETGWAEVFGSEHPASKHAKAERERIEAEMKKQQAGGK